MIVFLRYNTAYADNESTMFGSMRISKNTDQYSLQ